MLDDGKRLSVQAGAGRDLPRRNAVQRRGGRVHLCRVIDPEFEHFFERASALRSLPLRHLGKVEAVDDMTVDLVLDQAWGPFLLSLAPSSRRACCSC